MAEFSIFVTLVVFAVIAGIIYLYVKKSKKKTSNNGSISNTPSIEPGNTGGTVEDVKPKKVK